MNVVFDVLFRTQIYTTTLTELSQLPMGLYLPKLLGMDISATGITYFKNKKGSPTFSVV